MKSFNLIACAAVVASAAVLPRNETASLPFEIVINTPANGDVDGLEGVNWLVDLTIQSTNAFGNDIIPYNNNTTLFANGNDSLWHPGANSVFPGLVILVNTSTTSYWITGPNTNLAGLCQENGIATTAEGLYQYNALFQPGTARWTTGPAELVVYYVNGTAPFNASFAPTTNLLSNVARVTFEISNRTSISSDVSKAANSSSLPAISFIHPAVGDTVGADGWGWTLNFEFTAVDDSFSTENGYVPALLSAGNPKFGTGAASQIFPGLVVMLNNTEGTANDTTTFRGPTTNLAAITQVNSMKTVNGTQVLHGSWFVGDHIISEVGATQATVFFVNGTAPAYVNETTLAGYKMLTQVGTLDFSIA